MIRNAVRYSFGLCGALFVFSAAFVLLSCFATMIGYLISRDFVRDHLYKVILYDVPVYVVSAIAARASLRGTLKVYPGRIPAPHTRTMPELLQAEEHSRVAQALATIETSETT